MPGLRRTMHRTRQRARGWLTTPPLAPPHPVLPQPPAYTSKPLPAHVRARREPLERHATALVRPYVVAHERHIERELQREHGAAAALATYGIDYDPVLPLAVGSAV